MSRPAILLQATVVLILAANFGAAQKASEVTKRQPDAQAPRGEVLEWRSKEGRPYWYRLPEKGKESKNLLIMLHGTGVPHGWAFWNYPIAAGRFRPGDIVVAPEGMTPGGGESFNFIQNDDDGGQIAGLIRAFKSDFEIERVYLYGHSQGAFFCYWFAGRHPELVDGIVAHAGNLLANVAHPQLAREKVAIAILHGRADAVVPVECATSTEKALRELGYAKLKLEIVEGLTAQSGHWPLPGPVGELLDWLDQVSAADAATALEVAERALASPKPELEDLVAFVARAEELVGRHRGGDRKELQLRMEQVGASFEAALDRVIDALVELDPKAKEDSATAALFRLAVEALADRPRARKELRAALSAARGERKEVAKLIDRLGRKRDEKSLRAAVKTLERRFLAPERTELARLVLQVLDQAPEDLRAEDRTGWKKLAEGVIALDRAARERLPGILARPAAADGTDAR